jgi:hypothetical protein
MTGLGKTLSRRVEQCRGGSCTWQTGSLYTVHTVLGCSQAVRQRFLVSPCEGSNPSTPAILLIKRSVPLIKPVNEPGKVGEQPGRPSILQTTICSTRPSSTSASSRCSAGRFMLPRASRHRRRGRQQHPALVATRRSVQIAKALVEKPMGVSRPLQARPDMRMLNRQPISRTATPLNQPK